MDKQVHIYSISTDAFYNEREMKIHRRLNKNYWFRNDLKKLKNKKNVNADKKDKADRYLTVTNKRIQKLKDRLYSEFAINANIRNLNEDSLSKKNIISVFESVLSRTLGIQQNTVSKDIMVVQTYFFDVLEDIISNGFMYNNEKYVCFTASAGQIRTKKTVFIKESVLTKHQNTLMCGLTADKINRKGGVNINKYLAYLALCNSATDLWEDFDINKAIVVEDMEASVRSLVDFIDDKTYDITRQEMDMLINHTDGCGMILPKKSKKSFMVRSPWIKGLLASFPFDKFIREVNKANKDVNCGIIKDIYGKEYDILNDGIEVIFTKSQFKMWKYYSSWDEYKENYLKYNCQTGKCNEEEDVIGDAKLNYQMLQTLTDITDEELEILCASTKNHIVNIGRDRKTMLKVLGVTESNKNKNYIQQALEVYPELLSDTYCKEILKKVKKSMVKDARAGKIHINGKYSFIIPDLYAFCEWLFLNDRTPKGLLKNGEVSCSLYKNVEKLNCLRSPHLYREHAVRTNVLDKEKKRWFTTKGLYASCHDPISKILMFDVDGDKSLVVADKTLVECAERHMQDIVPLHYNMAKAEAETVNNQSIYNGLKAAYTGGNIGMISNDITKIWNSNNVNLDVIKWLCMENNFVIDYAKTLYKLTRPIERNKLIKGYTKSKTPHFFIYAKDKDKENVEKVNNSVVNKLEKIIHNPTLNFRSANLGKFDYKMLMSGKNADVELDQNIIDKYTELDTKSHFMINKENGKQNNTVYIYIKIKEELLKVNSNKTYVADVLIEHLYKEKKSNFKTTLWECFGDVILENLSYSVEEKFKNTAHIQCDGCGERIVATNNRMKYCDACWKKHRKSYKAKKAREYRGKRGQIEKT